MFEGIYCPSITITDDEGKIDYELWGKHLDHLADAGIDGVLLFGSIGEFFSFSLEDKKAALAFAVERVAGRMKVLAGVGDTMIANVIEFTKFAEQVAADGVVAVSPYYFGPSAPTARVRISPLSLWPTWRASTRTSAASRTRSTPSAIPAR